MGFAAEVMMWADKVQRREDVFVQELSREMFAAVIEATPVDQGTTVANWNASIGEPNGKVDRKAKDPDRSATTAAMEGVVSQAAAGEVAWLANGYFVASLLERGTKTNSPVGMVATALASAPAFAARALAKAQAVDE
jgi:hypothetical protein